MTLKGYTGGGMNSRLWKSHDNRGLSNRGLSSQVETTMCLARNLFIGDGTVLAGKLEPLPPRVEHKLSLAPPTKHVMATSGQWEGLLS
ncbi:hypothetical protein RJT34_12079 [Clitoria ternatea]|uniref:Uncharacterized protein n=1 Tax=Clitoria ternatea TaxID=43366 RepID=A0AAN9PKB7_CLITE